MLCLDMELVPEEILKLGIQHTYERFQDFAERGWTETMKQDRLFVPLNKHWYD